MDYKTNELLYDLSSNEYHGAEGSFSSSQLKTMLEDPEMFKKKYIELEEERVSIPAFDVGTYYHTAVLEPHLLDKECIVYGGRRIGKKWEEFKETHSDKAIITKGELKQAEKLIDATKSSPRCKEYLDRCDVEVSVFLDIHVYEGDIYCEDRVLGFYGWRKVSPKIAKVAQKKGLHMIIKCRCDAISKPGDKNPFILDLKSTSGNAKDRHKIKQKISGFNYDLSAAMYLDAFSIVYGQEMEEFIWTFASKDKGNCKNYRAKKESILIGRQKWSTAVLKIAHYTDKNWVIEDEIDDLEPNYFERQWIENKDEVESL